MYRAFLPGATREGETLTLEVDDGALPPGAGAVHVRWQRGARGPAAEAGSVTFKTILGAKSAQYTLGRSDVGCVIRAIGAADSPVGPGRGKVGGSRGVP